MMKAGQGRHAKPVNLVLYLTGILLMPMGVVLTIHSGLGAGGYDAWNFALSKALGVPVSAGICISSLCVILLTACIRRGFLRITTFITSFLLGISTDFWNWAYLTVAQEKGNACLIFFLGMVIVAVSAAAYMEGDLPPGPTDDLVVALHRNGMGLGAVKLVLDIICVMMAFALGGEIGLGTVLLTFGLGPLIGGFHGCILKMVNKLENRGNCV